MKKFIYTGDDCIYIKSNKTATNGSGRDQAKLSGNYKKYMYKSGISSYGYADRNGSKIYTNNIESIPKEYRTSIFPCNIYTAKLKNNNSVTVEQNEVTIKVLHLLNKTVETRYRLIVDVLVELVDIGILKYSSRVEKPTRKNISEAMRNRGLRDWFVFKYEHNIFFDYEFGTKIFKNLKDSKYIEQKDKYENTIYLRTRKQITQNTERLRKGKKQLKTPFKFYNMKPKHNIPAFKLEVTIDSTMIKAQAVSHRKNNDILNLKKISVWLDHPSIQDMKSVHKKVKSGIMLLIDNLCNEVIDIVKENLGVNNKKDIPEKMLDPFFTLKAVIKRVDTIEKNQVKIKQNQDKILSHLGLKED